MARPGTFMARAASLCLLLALACAGTLPAAAPARAQSGADIRYMNLNDETVGGRRLTFRDKTVISFFKNHEFTISGPLHVGFYESGGRKPTKGTWDVRYGNTVYITMEDASSRAYVFFKIDEKLYLRTVTGGQPNYGDLIINIAPLR